MEQILVFITLGFALVLFIWGKPRYDIVAVLGLVFLTLLGIIPYEEAFLGFGHPAVITVAAVLVVSKSLEKSGLVNLIVRLMDKVGGNITLQVSIMCLVVSISSGFMNNIGALALFMPVAIQLARKHKYSPSAVLMPIAFASLLGGMTTLIGTPPNIIIATFRTENGANAFGMFDFLPVGIGLTLAGLVFLSFAGWRLLPKRQPDKSEEDLFEINNYITEVRIGQNASIVGKTVNDITSEKELDIKVLGMVRNRERIHAPGPYKTLKENDILILECDTVDLGKFLDSTKTELVGDETLYNNPKGEDEIVIMEGIIQENSPLIGQTAASLHMRSRYDVNLLALARSTKTIRQRIDHVVFQSGDVLLLQGREKEMGEIFNVMQCYPLAKRSLTIGKPKRTLFAMGLFALSIIAVVTGWAPVEIAFTLAAVLMVIMKVLPIRDLYTSIDWPVIVLLAAMIPVGIAFETSGGADTITQNILTLSESFAPWLLLGLIMAVTMVLSGVINNAATVVLMAPIGIKIAHTLGHSMDPYLMAIAIGASAAFLTPIGHQSNTLVMSPGGYKFSDYWKMGLPMSIIILALGIPLILFFWPL